MRLPLPLFLIFAACSGGSDDDATKDTLPTDMSDADTDTDTDADADTDVDTDADADTDTDTDTDPVPDSGTADTAPVDTGVVTGAGLLVPPAAVASESSWCWTVAPIGGQIGVFVAGMDSGTVLEVMRVGSVTSSFHTSGLAYDGVSELVMAGYDGSGDEWHVIDLAAGTVTVGSVGTGYEEAISRLGNEYATSEETFADAAALLAGTPSGTLPSMSGFSRFHIDGTTLYGAWHSTDEVEVFDVTTGTQTGVIPLDNYDTWVQGVGVAGGYLHLIDDGRGFPAQTDPRIARFDLSGNSVSDVMLTGHPWTHDPSGLWCDAP